MNARVLLVDDDPAVREALCQTLELADLHAIPAGSFIEAKDHIARDFDGIVVSDIRMPGKDGFAVLDHARAVDPDLPVILLTGEGDIPMAVRGITAGAFAFLEKPCAPAEFLDVVARALKARALVLENRRLKRQLTQGDAATRLLIGTSDRIEALRREVRAVARTGAEVLITGEPGTGTARAAEAIHLLSGGTPQGLHKHAAAALSPDGLAEAFRAARGGTLYLDEVAGLPPAAQLCASDLLDGASGVRVIAGTNRDLEAEAAAGRFHPDLFHRLDVVRVRIPALRERTGDIPMLFRHYVTIACEQSAQPVPEIPPDLLARLMAQDWPGNARALMNAAMRFAMGLDDRGADGGTGLNERMAQVERSLIVDALGRHGGNATEAARTLKLPRKTFYDKLARHGIRAEDFR